MKSKKIAAALIAASTAIIPVSGSTALHWQTTAYAEDTAGSSSESAWVPTDFESAQEFRNSYGATHIEGADVCIVFRLECTEKDADDSYYRYNYPLRGTSSILETAIVNYYSSDDTNTVYAVVLIDNRPKGEFDVEMGDGLSVYSYSFIAMDINYTFETDIFSWLPDCETEYKEYVKKNGEVSVKDNFVVLCLDSNAGTSFEWQEKSQNYSTRFKLQADYFCDTETTEPVDGGSTHRVIAYKAVKNGHVKLEWEYGDITGKTDAEKDIIADCVILDDAQTVLLPDDVRIELTDYDTDRRIELAGESVFSLMEITDQPKSDSVNEVIIYNPFIMRNAADRIDNTVGLHVADGYSLPKTDDYRIDSRYDNGAKNVIFKVESDIEAKFSEKTTKITFYDNDTGEMIELPDDGVNIYLMKSTSETPPESEYFDIKTNPCVINSLNVFDPTCKYTFNSGVKSGRYDPVNFEVLSYNPERTELACKMKWSPSGDVNSDGSLSIADALLMQKWLLNSESTKIDDLNSVDFCRDNRIDVFDLIVMRKKIIQNAKVPAAISIKVGSEWFGTDQVWKVYNEDDKYFLSYSQTSASANEEIEPFVTEITEDEYTEIMSQDYNNMIDVYNNSEQYAWGSGGYETVIDYTDGTQTETRASMLSVLSIIDEMRLEYMNIGNDYIKPDKRIDFDNSYEVVGDGVYLYRGPDESYETVAYIPRGYRIAELGYQNNNNSWIFAEFNGLYGWVDITDDAVKSWSSFGAWGKPVIYLYPEKETDVHVELELTTSELYTTYPKYNDGWDVTAYPDGSLLNKADGTHHKYLFWESVNAKTRFDLSKGFCIAGEDTEKFLKEKLTYMGLTEEEMNEFIVYWLPKMEHNKYNLITFQGDLYTNSAKLDITPEPDSLLRIFMVYVPLENAIDIEPQQLETFERKGFTVVEWGGCDIK